jgi:hypothetical protein
LSLRPGTERAHPRPSCLLASLKSHPNKKRQDQRGAKARLSARTASASQVALSAAGCTLGNTPVQAHRTLTAIFSVFGGQRIFARAAWHFDRAALDIAALRKFDDAPDLEIDDTLGRSAAENKMLEHQSNVLQSGCAGKAGFVKHR